MDYETLLEIDNEIKSLQNNNNYYSLESMIINIFSNEFNQDELNNLAKLNKKINQYIDFIHNSGEIFFSQKVLKNVAKLKQNIYDKTNELVEYKNNLPSYNEEVIDLKRYAYALDFILNLDNSNLEKYRRNIIVISEIQNTLKQTIQKYDDNNLLSKKIYNYANLLNDFIDHEFNNRYIELKNYKEKINLIKIVGVKKKIYVEEMNNAIDDCLDLLKRG
ncbi:MAG: hypothetical protein ACMXX8_01385 [Candidatus Woesearchaeota archaeon]